MKVISLMRQHHALVAVEIELSLSPGLPQIVVLGLPDAMIKESVLRIKSALKHQGFEWPRAQQILVHLKPSHLKKSSLGFDLAIAVALLWETKQIKKIKGDVIVYGELSLKGEALTPLDVARAAGLVKSDTIFLTGEASGLPFGTLQVKQLTDLKNPKRVEPQAVSATWERPRGFYRDFSHDQAELMVVIVAGEHNALIAGPPGVGKTALAEEIGPLLDDPSPEGWAEQVMWAQHFQQTLTWRPVVQVHHSIPHLSMVGGGVALKPGEITRAHGGVLIMDELLEYTPRVQDALREPVESGMITLARSGCVTSYPADFLLIGTTNLCACGQFDFERETKCRCRSAKRDGYLARLNGPFVDRFSIFKIMSARRSGVRVAAAQIREKVEAAIGFRKNARGQFKPNSRLPADEVSLQLQPSVKMKSAGSQRRTLSVLQVARTLADLECSDKICQPHVEQACVWAQRDFDRVQAYRPQSFLRGDAFAPVSFPLSLKRPVIR